jgi:hypothetical protein
VKEQELFDRELSAALRLSKCNFKLSCVRGKIEQREHTLVVSTRKQKKALVDVAALNPFRDAAQHPIRESYV